MRDQAESSLRSLLTRIPATPGRLAELLDERTEPMIAFTSDRKIIAANASAERFFGYGRRELDSQPIEQILPERLRQPDAPPPLASDDLTTVEIPGLRKDGSEIATVWTYGFAPSPAGPVFVLVVFDRAQLSTELEALRRGDARYRSLLLASAAIIWVTDGKGEFVEPQARWAGYTGQPWEEHRGFGWAAALHPDDRARVSAEWSAAVSSKSAHYRTHGRVWSASQKAWRAFQAQAVPVLTDSGELREWVGSLTDVQDEVDAQMARTQRELELEHRFRAVYENALDGIVLSNDGMAIVDANPAACRLLGRARDRVLGTSFAEMIPAADREGTPARMGEFRVAGSMTGEAKMLLPDGTVRRVEFGAVANVSPGLHLSIFRDIEDRRRAEEAQQFLDEASRLLGASLDYDETLASIARLAVPRTSDWAAVDLLDDNGTFRRVAVAHVDPKKIELAHELRRRQQPSIDDPTGLGAVVRTGTSDLVELVTDEMLVAALAADPELLAIIRGLGLVSAMTVPLAARGKIIGAISFVSAESRRRYGRADLAVAEELARRAGFAIENAMHVRELAQATRKKDEFLAMLGHELRNPLAPIVTASALIRVRGKATPRELEIIDRQARHLVRLVDDLLDISRITSGKLSLVRTPLELTDLLAQAIESTSASMEARGLRFIASIAPSSMPIDADRERLVQVVTNILANAAKFTPAGKSIFLTAALDGSDAVLTVRDEGQGIEAELLPQVFDLFVQGAQRNDRQSGGLGLGLSIARSLVLAHDGRIDVASPGPGQGTTVTVRLPMLASAHPGPSRQEPADAASAAASQRRRILIVDDNTDNAEMLALFLGQVGYEPFVAGDARRALSLASELAPDAAILDIGLPDIDGYDLARALRSALGERTPKLVALTGYARDSDRKRALESGFNEHLAKPVDMWKLASILQGLLPVPGARHE